MNAQHLVGISPAYKGAVAASEAVMSRSRRPRRARDALAYLAARVADGSGKHPKVRWTTSDGREHALTLPKKPYGSANAQSLARLRRALEGASQ